MKKSIIAGLGEVLWDIFPDYKRPGGAPVNVAFHATQLGHHGVPLTRVGNDAMGKELLSLLESRSLDLSYIQKDPEAPTGSVTIRLEKEEASYEFKSDVAWDRLSITPKWRDLAKKTEAVCFGTLAQRAEESRSAIRDFISSTPDSSLKIADLNFREPYYSPEVIEATLQLASIIKLNEEEWKKLQELYGVRDLKSMLLEKYNIDIVCLTKGAKGAELMTLSQHFIEPVHPVESSEGDSVGVGDAFTACLTHHLLQNSPLDVALRSANKYASAVASRKGAMPLLSSEVIKSIL